MPYSQTYSQVLTETPNLNKQLIISQSAAVTGQCYQERFGEFGARWLWVGEVVHEVLMVCSLDSI